MAEAFLLLIEYFPQGGTEMDIGLKTLKNR